MKNAASKAVDFAKERPIATIGIAASILALLGLGLKTVLGDGKKSG